MNDVNEKLKPGTLKHIWKLPFSCCMYASSRGGKTTALCDIILNQ